MKKLVSLTLALIMVLCMATLANAEGDKPFKGRNIDLWGWGFDFDYLLDTDGNLRNVLDSNNFVYAAVLEWCEKNECTFTYHAQASDDDLKAAIATGNSPDLLNAYGGYPNFFLNGITQALDADTVAAMKEKFGGLYFDVMTYMGDCYGVAIPWNAIAVFRYDKTVLEEYGIKSPREYYEEGNWNFETFKQFRKDCTFDSDGDGKINYGAGHENEQYLMVDAIEFDENGLLTSKVDSERFRDYYQMWYESCAIDKTNVGGAWSSWFQVDQDGIYAIGTLARYEHWYCMNGQYVINGNGHIIECCPIPMWKQGDTEQRVNMNGVSMQIPSGAKNKDMAIDLMSFILECGLERMDDMSGDQLNYDLEGLQGSTEFTKKYLELSDAAVALHLAELEILGVTEEDIAWASNVINFYNKDANYMFDLSLPGANFSITSGHYSELFKVPVATFIAEYGPVHQAMCDTFNNTYITK